MKRQRMTEAANTRLWSSNGHSSQEKALGPVAGLGLRTLGARLPAVPVEQSRAGVAGEQRSEGGEKRESREKQSSGAGPDSSAAAACSGVVCARRRLDASQLLMWPLDPRWQSKPPKTSQNRL